MSKGGGFKAYHCIRRDLSSLRRDGKAWWVKGWTVGRLWGEEGISVEEGLTGFNVWVGCGLMGTTGILIDVK